MQGKMAIIGDGDAVLAFSAVGIDTFPISCAEDGAELIKTLAKSYKIIFVTESVAEVNDEIIKRYLSQPYPIILPIPSEEKENSYGMQTLRSAMEKALGVDILFGKDN